MQAFKINDALEARVRGCFTPLLDQLSDDRDEFYDGVEEAYPLGRVIWDLKRAPLTDELPREIYAASFFAIFGLFTRPGTFEFYLSVCRAVWGDDVEVEFSTPNPGWLTISITAATIVQDDFVARQIESGQYVYYTVLDDAGDTIVFQDREGLRTQEQTNALFRDLVPAGIYIQTPLIAEEEEIINLTDENDDLLTDEDGTELING